MNDRVLTQTRSSHAFHNIATFHITIIMYASLHNCRSVHVQKLLCELIIFGSLVLGFGFWFLVLVFGLWIWFLILGFGVRFLHGFGFWFLVLVFVLGLVYSCGMCASRFCILSSANTPIHPSC